MRRVVVTGLGAVTPLGNNMPDTWRAMLDGRSGVRLIEQFDASDFEVRIAGEVRDFHPEELIPAKELRRMDRGSQFGVAAALEALQDANLRIDDSNRERVGVVFGVAGAGYGVLMEGVRTLAEKGYRRVNPFLVSHHLADAASGHIAILTGCMGPNMGVLAACSTGSAAIGEAWEIVRRGDADAMLAGGGEAPIVPIIMAGFHALRALEPGNEAPEKACKPFDARRTGFVVGEGAGMVLLEALDSALARGARIYAEMVGAGWSNDAHDMVASEESGRGPALAMAMALRKAGLQPEAVDYINAHGTGTPLNDRVETTAIKAVFGEHARSLAVSSTKSMLGHMMGGAGAVEAAACILAVAEDAIPPTINYEVPDPDCDLDYVPNVARYVTVRAAMSNSIGLGGHNAAVLFKKYEP